ncbi:MAG TPA: hypothetical protein DCL48_08145 [Alphaproteobacteria bacterium]|nr:hypothetical protein [Alphaproteobacteria bacterium]
MTEDTSNLMLEYLKRIRSSQERVELEVVDIKERMSAIDESLALLHTMYAQQSKRIDRIEDRLGRIERRLDLVDVS